MSNSQASVFSMDTQISYLASPHLSGRHEPGSNHESRVGAKPPKAPQNSKKHQLRARQSCRCAGLRRAEDTWENTKLRSGFRTLKDA